MTNLISGEYVKSRGAIQRSVSIIHVGLVVGGGGVRTVYGLIAVTFVFSAGLLAWLAGFRSIYLVLKVNWFLLEFELPALLLLLLLFHEDRLNCSHLVPQLNRQDSQNIRIILNSYLWQAFTYIQTFPVVLITMQVISSVNEDNFSYPASSCDFKCSPE